MTNGFLIILYYIIKYGHYYNLLYYGYRGASLMTAIIRQFTRRQRVNDGKYVFIDEDYVIIDDIDILQ